MKNKTKTQLLSMILFVSIIVIVYLIQNPRVVKVPVKVPTMMVPQRPMRSQEIRREPEFRGPPIKKYKPGRMQQMGLITNGDETLPLYGKEVRGRRDRYNYYTTTGGENLYPFQ